MDKINLRAVYAKYGNAKYFSHLDLMRTMQRAIKRSGIPIWYTEGFNPHIYLNFPVALPLGTESYVEPMDFSVVEECDLDELRDKLDNAMPPGLNIISVKPQIMKNTDVVSAEYDVTLSSENLSAEDVIEGFRSFLSADTIEIHKRSKKKGEVIVDIKPHVIVTDISSEDGLAFMHFKLPAGNSFNLNVNTVLDAFTDKTGISVNTVCIKRTKITAINGEDFV
ncbi:MAG: DUF2344 domain-containing protein [Oscillospiraceae bacterium]|nr:DUF2344 domain-containing protein [Oscillospiraceae bacterium]